jgi:hypothetical protein
MAKSTKKPRKLTTNEALELLLGRKAAKRIRQVATQLAAEDSGGTSARKAAKKR